MLYAIVFVCGGALMGLELVATRVLAPFLGSSIFVWGSVISVVMIALSLGYWIGGEIADRLGAPRALAPLIALSGLLTALAPLIAERVLPASAELGPRAGSLAAAAAIFFAPALLLATVSPLGVRIAANAGLARIGRSAGGLYAISTGGSIVGTLATAFWLIPALSLEPLIVGIGYVLFATAVLSLALPRIVGETAEAAGGPARAHRPSRAVPALTLVCVVAGVFVGGYVLARVAPAPARNSFGERVLYRADTQYHRITVTEDATQRHLRFDRSHQSAMSLSDPFTGSIRYPDYFHLALALNPRAQRVLVLGLGGGSVTKRFWRDYPGVRVDTVEIDPVVFEVAEKYFHLPSDSRLQNFTEDARRYVQRTSTSYDIVIIDAYNADSLPFHLTTEEFFREIDVRLAPGGVVAYNVIGSVTGERSELFRSIYRTANTVWGQLWAFPIGLGKDGVLEANRNIVLFASNTSVPRDVFEARIESRVDGRVTVEGFAGFAADLYAGPVGVADVPLLTDAHAPTDSLIRVN